MNIFINDYKSNYSNINSFWRIFSAQRIFYLIRDNLFSLCRNILFCILTGREGMAWSCNRGGGGGGEKRIVLSSALCLAWLSRAIAALIWYGLGLLSHTLSTWVFCMQAVSAGVLVLLFLTAGSAPLRPHVKLCGNSGGGWKSPIKHTKSVGGETGSVSGEIPAEWFNLLGRPGWGHRGSLLP